MEVDFEREPVEAAGDVPWIAIRMMLQGLDNQDLNLSKVHGPQGWRFHSICPRLRRKANH